MTHLLGQLLAIISLPVVSYIVILDIREHHPNAVAVVTFFFWLTVILVPVLTEAAIAVGAIGQNGSALNAVGHFLKDKLLTSSYDLGGELHLYLAIILVLVGPQLLSFLCGLVSGCASKPTWVAFGYKLFMWAMAKAAVIGGAVIFSFTGFVYVMHPGWTIFDNVKPSLAAVGEAAFLGAIGFTASLLILWIGFGCRFLTIVLQKEKHIACIIGWAIRRATKYQRKEDSGIWPLRGGIAFECAGVPEPIRATFIWPLPNAQKPVAAADEEPRGR